MSLSSLKGFIDRHKRKFIITGIIIGGTYVTLHFIKKKFIELQDKQTKELIDRTKRLNHFESTERTCNQAIIGLCNNLNTEIIKLLNTNDILDKLRNNPDNKIELWENLKIISFTRLTTLVYATSMLIVTLRVQLNILGGYIYKDNILDNDDNKKITDNIRQSYLTLIQYFLTDGIKDLIILIKSKVKDILCNHPLNEKLNLANLEQIFWSIQMSINNSNNDPNNKISYYMLPSIINNNINNNNDELLKKMYNETLDMLESDDVSILCSNNVSRGFSIVVDNIAEYYSEMAKSNDNTKITENINNTESGLLMKNDLNTITTETDSVININNIELHLAKIIPIINGITSKAFDNTSKPQDLPTSLTTFFLVSEKIKTLGANVYEVFST